MIDKISFILEFSIIFIFLFDSFMNILFSISSARPMQSKPGPKFAVVAFTVISIIYTTPFLM